MKNISKIILFTMLLYSCSHLSEGEKIIQNKSAKDIKVKVLKKQYKNEVGNSVVIMSGREGSIWKLVSKSGPIFRNKEECVDTFIDSIIIEIVGDTQLKISKNLNNRNNWTFSKSELDTECRAIIYDSDIIPK
ncbi:MAG: hypothetical protein ABS67_00100 [Niabella sp. SCN 42-15]|nr:MAG: hypothetical protein ABS67_00100 [Niabella sp. SCN 42-15]